MQCEAMRTRRKNDSLPIEPFAGNNGAWPITGEYCMLATDRTRSQCGLFRVSPRERDAAHLHEAKARRRNAVRLFGSRALRLRSCRRRSLGAITDRPLNRAPGSLCVAMH